MELGSFPPSVGHPKLAVHAFHDCLGEGEPGSLTAGARAPFGLEELIEQFGDTILRNARLVVNDAHLELRACSQRDDVRALPNEPERLFRYGPDRSRGLIMGTRS